MRLTRNVTAGLTAAVLAVCGLAVQAPTTAHAAPTDPGFSDETELAAALKRDLGITLEQFRQAGALAEKADALQAELAGKSGLQRFALRDGDLVAIGTGAELQAAAAARGITVSSVGATGVSLHDFLRDYLAQVGPAGLVSVGMDADGFVINVAEPGKAAATPADNKSQPKKSAVDFAKQYKNVKVVKKDAKLGKVADVYDGQGTYSSGVICSLGFGAWSAAGTPMALSAGHCLTSVGSAVYARDPQQDKVMSGSDTARNVGQIGTYAWANFGSTDEANPGTDLSTINATGGQNLIPAVLRWQSSGVAGNATANPAYVTGTASPVIGAPVCRSGRTSGWQCSTISYIGAAAVQDGTTLKFVDGFASNNLYAAPGDSGGSAITGYKALGVTSAVGRNADGSYITTFASLSDLARYQPGITVKTYLWEPRIVGSTNTGPSTYSASTQAGPLQVQVPVQWGDSLAPGTQVVVTLDGAPYGTYTPGSDGYFTMPYSSPAGTHTLTMQAKNGYNTSATTTTTIVTVPSVPGAFVPWSSPQRVLDTRNGTGAPAAKVAPGATVSLPIASIAGVSASTMGSVTLNLTVTDTTTPGFITAYPSGTTMPNASSLNFVAGQTVPNLVTVKVGADGRVNLTNMSSGSVNLVADMAGFSVANDSTPEPGSFTPVAPSRILDTRAAIGVSTTTPIPANSQVTLQIAGRGGLPAGGIGSAVLNVTATNPRSSGFLTLYPTGTAQPNASSVNFGPGATVANQVTVKVGADGKVVVANTSPGSTDVVVDVAGFYAAGAVDTTKTGLFVPVSPARLLDTRSAIGTAGTSPVGSNSGVTIQLAGRGGLPASGIGGVVLNLTATAPQGPGFLTLYPAGGRVPNASNVNFVAGQTVANAAVSKAFNSAVTVHNSSSGSTHVVADVAGYFTA